MQNIADEKKIYYAEEKTVAICIPDTEQIPVFNKPKHPSADLFQFTDTG